MQFSERTSWPAGENAIAQAVTDRRAAGLPILDLTETNPTRCGLGLPADFVLPDARLYEPEPLGSFTARQAIVAYHRGRVRPEHVCLTASTSEAYAWLFQLLCEPGDSIAVPAPSYPLFSFLAKIASVRLVPYVTRAWDSWSIDFDSLRSAMDERTRAVIIVSPNNPTGARLHSTDRDRLVERCRERGAALISDEVFADYAEPNADRVATVCGEGRVLSFVLSGLSKVCLAPQLKVGWMAVSGPDDMRDEVMRRIDLVADTFLSVNTPSQLAVPSLLTRVGEIQAPVKERLAANRKALETLAGSTATVLPADGGWNAVIRLPATRSEDEWTLALLGRAVLAHPGYFFDFAEAPYLIVSLLPEESKFAEAVGRLRSLLDDQKI